MERVIKLILFYVEFDNGDSNCYQGDRVPTIEEARILCKGHIDSNHQWEDVAYVGKVGREQAEGLWDLSSLDREDWPVFRAEVKENNTPADRPFAYVCSPFRGDTEANTERAREYCRQVFDAGYTPLAPHLIFPQFLNDGVPDEREAGIGMGTSLLPLCRVLLVCGNNITEGMKAEIQQAQRLGIEVCALENIPPIPSLKNYRDDLTNLENFDIAVSLIEGMTGCRFNTGFCGVSINPDENAYFTVNMREKADHKTGLCHIGFDANIRTMGHPMDADGLLKLQRETERVHTLLTLLESREFTLTSDEMVELYNTIRQDPERQAGSVTATAAQCTEKLSVLEKIAAARSGNKDSPVKKETDAKKSKSRKEER